MVNLFRRFVLLTIVAVIGLIFVGGFVRASGAGMGCPDWPKCFGMWVPPTSVDQLPFNYQEIFGAKLKGEVVFNATKTWIEYINRLLGVLVGFFIFLTVIFSYKAYYKTHSKIFYLSFFAFILVLFEGWLGAKVVSSELLPGMITIHMLVSIVILGLLVLALLKTYFYEKLIPKLSSTSDLVFLIIIVLILSLGQIVFGTQIREGIDLAQRTFGDSNRDLWLLSVKGKVYFHTGISLLILVFHFLIFKKAFNNFKGELLFDFSKGALIVVLFSVITGVVLNYLSLPAMVQPIHLTLGTIVLTLQFVLLFLTKPEIIN
ncbi:heme A synthase [Lacihabitans sp. LS3-19]|uniref:COX15/CtaA family protein n=1 Tax=Lacihabitans sp. LS3-19 TaxID=2487335 RepID=UPI0020CCAF44|nr:COX15/CtaA family protein [Lacihabitans sp. LS3-19]MCP9768810.1 heme A synthase [Lacihabitans sp. LS3-19]